ncbi:MAG: 3-hydroxyacyl-CoA dehydrogenase family protein [Planctomycetaceae bacterium]|nr:3-hydroxyacyl-CoA dehydrogenase family protein [Planctomycetaceae bacterium]MBT6153788.1 3-hydroxyacyl-CoA dehydrogenase family protein [Planctomycetaceae bacterium]MBT6485048.1 3-hydroxyacyl-CoA dehydrogenase family protein [Planctomycetaceae bacterium]MBT6495535.1 3-hydroxyacyl-CoA dehydrogenase family protein [Planctomycetaceae bacterium]
MQAKDIQRVGVLGLGTMGHGIAQTFAAADCSVTAFDESEAARSTAIERIRSNLVQMAAEGLIDASAVEEIVERIVIVDQPGRAVEEAEFVVEAVLENLPLKQALFPQLESWVSVETVLASNTSTFPMTQISRDMQHPERAINTHWFNPPHLVPVVEVVPGERTSPEVTELTLELHKRIGKQAVRINREIPGLLVNRVQIAMIREVFHLWDQGIASAEDIDTAVRGSMGFRMAANGPLEIADFGGLDVWLKVFEGLAPEIRSDSVIPSKVREIVDEGHYGMKTGQGIYDYPPEVAEQKRHERDQRFMALAKLFYGQSSGDEA